jgi:hypothetical protein
LGLSFFLQSPHTCLQPLTLTAARVCITWLHTAYLWVKRAQTVWCMLFAHTSF